MEPKEKKAFEPSGLVPRSIVRTFERFRQQLLPGSETAAIREYRISRYQVLVSARCLFTLLTIPIATNWLVSSWILSPLIEHFWNTQQNEIFLNSYQEERAFAELEFFSEKIFFESLLNNIGTFTMQSQPSILESTHKPNLRYVSYANKYLSKDPTPTLPPASVKLATIPSEPEGSGMLPLPPSAVQVCKEGMPPGVEAAEGSCCSAEVLHNANSNAIPKLPLLLSDYPLCKPFDEAQRKELATSVSLAHHGLQRTALLGQEYQASSLGLEIDSVKIKEKVQEKILELAIYYNQQTILSITNVVGDLVSIFTLGFLFIWMKPEIAILKSFLIEAIYSLSDTTKSFLLILLTDLLVGFHSPRGWETALELLLKHFGLPENQDFVFLFVATFPVLLDTVFKYWIFRHLNKISPSTVATYHSMIE